MVMVDVDVSSLQENSQVSHEASLVCKLAPGSRLALSYIHQMNRVNSGNYFTMLTAPWILHWISVLALISVQSLISGRSGFSRGFII